MEVQKAEKMNEYKFKAILKSVRSDEDGEGTITILVPLTEMPNLLTLPLQTKRILEVSIKSE